MAFALRLAARIRRRSHSNCGSWRARKFCHSDVLKEQGIVSLANVPILIGGAVWGVLEVDSSIQRDFSEDTTEFMIAAAAVIASSVQLNEADRSKAATLAATAAAAQTREVLLGELQHRVKNNFQLVLASIANQKRRFNDPDVDRALKHVANRISAISLAHEQLSPNQDLRAVDVAGYLRALCASIEQQADNVAIDVEADEVELAIERAVPLGLIVNEAVTNSITCIRGGWRPRENSAQDGSGLWRSQACCGGQRKGHPESAARRFGAAVDQIPRATDRRRGSSRTAPNEARLSLWSFQSSREARPRLPLS